MSKRNMTIETAQQAVTCEPLIQFVPYWDDNQETWVIDDVQRGLS